MLFQKYLLASLMIAGAVIAQQPDNGEAADEPGRSVARISVLSGDATVHRADADEAIAAAVNAPLLAGDSLSVAARGAAEIQFDRANFARLAGDTEIRISEFDNGRQQIQLGRGLVTWRVLRESTAQTEISTPSAAIRPGVNASVRIEVAPDGTTRITVRHGEAEVYTQRGTERVREGNSLSVSGTDGNYQVGYAPARDQWDTWNDERDTYLQRAQSPAYVSQDMYGTEDLDNYGRWDNDPQYGNVWMPTVASNWAPYQNGQWSWQPYYGWTWIDNSPWGWAPFHYGSWYQRAGFGWAWYPGRRLDRVWYRPALVGFFGFGSGGFGNSFGFGFGNIGWVPLAPFERYRPWYGRGWNGGRNVVINNVNIVRNTNVTNIYRNARDGRGVTAVSANDFGRGNFRNRVRVDGNNLRDAGLVRGQVPVNPGSQNRRFVDRTAASNTPRSDFASRQFYSRNAPQQQQQAQQRQQPQQARGESFTRTSPRAEGGSRMMTNPGWQRSQEDRSQQGTRGGFQRQDQPTQPRSESPRMTTNPSWGRFGNPQADSGRQSGESRQQMQVAPPIVRERQQEQSDRQNVQPRDEPRGSFGSPSGFGNERQGRAERGGFSAPQPQQQQAPQQPSFRGGGSGDGGFQRSGGGDRGTFNRGGSASQQQQAPSPAPSFRGGGGGGGDRGGGGGGNRGGDAGGGGNRGGGGASGGGSNRAGRR